MEFKTGDIVFVRYKFIWYKPWTAWSAIVRWIARIKHNHVGVVVMSWGVPMLNEAIPSGVHTRPLKDYLEHSKHKYSITIKRPDREINEEEYARTANSFLGQTKYDLLGLIPHQFMWNVFGVWIGAKNEEEAKKHMYCYEYANYMNKRDYELQTGDVWYKVIPQLLERAGWHFTIFEQS